MKRRHLYVLLFAPPILLASGIVAFAVFGASAGAVWLFVAGDNPWPAPVETALVIVFVLVFAASALGLGYGAYAVGRSQETRESLSAWHLLSAAAGTALLLLALVAHQRSVGNLGPKSDGILCSEFCRAKGFTASGMPPRNSRPATCSCYDGQGRESIKVPMREASADQRGK
jgi:hypothetical protein